MKFEQTALAAAPGELTMDHVRILNEIRSRDTLEQAFDCALHDRTHTDYYFDYFEIDYVQANRKQILDELADELKHPEKYTPRLAYAYYPPKTSLCYRRMVYLPFKDLLIRYGFCIVLSKYLESTMSPRSFANRRASGARARVALLEDFSTVSWPSFCEWQRDSIKESTVLVRTDISSFYDSISHRYLVGAIAEELSLSSGSGIMKLFERLLSVTVVSYSQADSDIKHDELNQGLPIGNSSEGYFANIYLNRVDGKMNEFAASKGLSFGRYNDDMRIFGKSREDALTGIRVLQELLLVKGLNLNGSKTMIAEDSTGIEDLRSKVYEFESSHGDEGQEDEEEVLTGADEPPTSSLKAHVDDHFHEFKKRFEPGQIIDKDNVAKDFCKFMSAKSADGTRLLQLSDRLPQHVQMLGEVMGNWQGSGKHAAWLLVQSAFDSRVPVNTRKSAGLLIFALLETTGVSSYLKYRILHHLVKLRQKSRGHQFRYLDKLTTKSRTRLQKLIPQFVAEPAFELNIVALHTLRCLGASPEEIKAVVKTGSRQPNAEPILNAISYMASSSTISTAPAISQAREEDDIESPY